MAVATETVFDLRCMLFDSRFSVDSGVASGLDASVAGCAARVLYVDVM